MHTQTHTVHFEHQLMQHKFKFNTPFSCFTCLHFSMKSTPASIGPTNLFTFKKATDAAVTAATTTSSINFDYKSHRKCGKKSHIIEQAAAAKFQVFY